MGFITSVSFYADDFCLVIFLNYAFHTRDAAWMFLFMWLTLAIVPVFGGHVWGQQNLTIALIPRIIHQLSLAFGLGALCYVIRLVGWIRKQNEGGSWKEFRTFFVTRMIVA